MPATAPDLWPTEFGTEATLAPVAILRQQGAALGERTKNIIVGRVHTTGNANGFRHDFILFCPPLAYQVQILSVEHSLDFYPARIDPVGEAAVVANDANDFTKKLADVLASERVKKVVRSLLAQAEQ